MNSDDDDETGDLGFGFGFGFGYSVRKWGDVQLHHRGRLAATLRGAAADEFLAEVADAEPAEAQQLMARVTGNYKRGNESRASQHPRNRG